MAQAANVKVIAPVFEGINAVKSSQVAIQIGTQPAVKIQSNITTTGLLQPDNVRRLSAPARAFSNITVTIDRVTQVVSLPHAARVTVDSGDTTVVFVRVADALRIAVIALNPADARIVPLMTWLSATPPEALLVYMDPDAAPFYGNLLLGMVASAGMCTNNACVMEADPNMACVPPYMQPGPAPASVATTPMAAPATVAPASTPQSLVPPARPAGPPTAATALRAAHAGGIAYGHRVRVGQQLRGFRTRNTY